jgi:hypothetical protein
MSSGFASMPASSRSNAAPDDGHPLDRSKGLLEVLASLSGFALVLATWYGLNIVMKLYALDVAPLIAN